MRYYVILTKGNTENAIKAFDDQSEAVAFGHVFFSGMKPGDGVLSVEGITEGDANRRLVYGWHF